MRPERARRLAGREKFDHVVDSERDQQERNADQKHAALPRSAERVILGEIHSRFLLSWPRRHGRLFASRTNSGLSQSAFRLYLQDLAAAVHPGLEIDVMRPAQFARVL